MVYLILSLTGFHLFVFAPLYLICALVKSHKKKGDLKSPKSHSLVLKAVFLLSKPIISPPCFYFICGNSFLGSESVRSLSSHLWLCPNTDTGKGHILHTIHGYLITLSMKTNNLWLAR